MNDALKRKSCFLFGPRQTGKTSLIRHTLKPGHSFNLLESDTYLALKRSPARLREEIIKPGALVVIDEVQKAPELLDEVQWLIEERRVRFLLTGSSARKMRRGGVNLLGGRAHSLVLHPLVSEEIGEIDFMRALRFGTLPSVYLGDAPERDLKDYVADYMQLEVAHEGLVRNIPAFSRFLEVAALCNGQMLNYSEIANDAQVPRTTVHEFFSILRDTLLGWNVEPWNQSKKRKPIVTPKFFLFDVGVARALQGRRVLEENTAELGEAFESFIAHELKAWVDYRHGSLHYWRTTSGFEVDFILNDEMGIEVKTTRQVTGSDLKALRALAEEKKMRRLLFVCRENRRRKVENIEIVPWREFLRELWAS
ncbi:MAG: ATP-binding protein [Myxococcaceae bacterium]|nr:ATP-binding protein [Myxococcaceae bacterium]